MKQKRKNNPHTKNSLAWGLLGRQGRLFSGGQKGFGFVNIFGFHDDATCGEPLDVADFDCDNRRLELAFLAVVEPRLQLGFVHNVTVRHTIDVRCLVRVVLQIELAVVFRLVHNERELLAVFGGFVTIPHFAVLVFDFRNGHAKLGGDTGANHVVVVGIDEAHLAADFHNAFERTTRPQLGSGFRYHAHETAIRSVGFDEANHFKGVADLNYCLIFHCRFFRLRLGLIAFDVNHSSKCPKDSKRKV